LGSLEHKFLPSYINFRSVVFLGFFVRRDTQTCHSTAGTQAITATNLTLLSIIIGTKHNSFQYAYLSVKCDKNRELVSATNMAAVM